ncbi:hypothetical protein [Serinibacter arcticus]|uniref:Uncharacterized protein n=1 Tax=Serinibacter arcticus TaxID=1655435 RepID=A0A4Z1E415_9MICO|nr:hypothetical protein [Serinibacter arcticus]TGO06686.1 hypothetical protein SERN_0878 [Serinibacter arcticus]
MSNLTRPSPLLTVLGLGGSAVAVAIGAAVAARGTTATVALGSLLATFGVTGLLAWVSRTVGARQAERAAGDLVLVPRADRIDGEDAVLHPRSSGPAQVLAHAALALMGVWALVMIVLALLRGAPGWLVLLVPWAVLVLGGPVMAAAGRLTPGGVYVTPTRVVDVDRGGRAEVALADVDLVTPMADRLLLRPRRAGAVIARRTAGPWSRKPRTDLLVVETLGLYGGSGPLADSVRRAGAGR